jgi:hypothetical protein
MQRIGKMVVLLASAAMITASRSENHMAPVSPDPSKTKSFRNEPLFAA